jgi:glycosyltransferase involved in cell wall biosynthesis
MPLPTVLVVMPTLGRRLDTLPHAVESVLSQTGVRARLVVVAPEDATAARNLVSAAGADTVDDPGRGLSAAMNAGVATSKGESYLAWLNDDDYLLSGGLGTLCSLFEARDDAVVAYGACIYVDEIDRKLGVNRSGRWAHRIQPWGPNLLPQPSALCRLSDVVAVGGYDESLKFSMDLDMFLRLRHRGAFVSTKDEIAAFRWHAESISVASRRQAGLESMMVRRRYLSPTIRNAAPLWERPVRWASHTAGAMVSRRAGRVARPPAADRS